MIYRSITFDPETATLHAEATGHPTDVTEGFRNLCELIFEGQGAWRMTLIHGTCLPDMRLESETQWKLRAERKVDHQSRSESQKNPIV